MTPAADATYGPWVDRFEGLNDAVAAALRHAPVDEKAQLEVAVRWPDLDGAAAHVAEHVRVRVLTWHPLGWLEDLPGPVVSVEGSGSDYRITLFVRAWMLDGPDVCTVEAEIGALARSIVQVGARNEASLISGEWAELEEGGLVPSLLGAVRLDADAPVPDIDLVADWSPIDSQTVAMVVTGAFRPLDLDMAPRPLSSRPRSSPNCAACAGARFSVPFDLDNARPGMCSAHRAEALEVMIRDVGTAMADDPDTWEILAHAAGDLLAAPHVPYPIRDPLLEALGIAETDVEADLADQADALLAFLAWAATPQRYEAAMWDLGWRPLDGGPARDDGTFDDVAHTVVYRLGASGQFELAARLVDALVPVIPHAAANLHGELATQLGEAGRIDDARARVRLALDDPSRDLLTEIFAGEVDEHSGDLAGAEARYRSTLATCRRRGDADFEHETLWHLIELLRDDDDRADEVAKLTRERDRVHARSMAPGRRTEAAGRSDADEDFGRKVGRNEPCPCGSGRKFKRCHGGSR